ncbi:MAG: hypothetical protein HDQ99_21945 [Lachnospiraceae bacterium]|nr:hypothetical protein [Lachnospiraceae bacterium]MBD5538253.1 hypothetical protein [Lachnospiraceae bacterium]
MNLTDIKEKELVKEWASVHASEETTKSILTAIDRPKESYWIVCNESEEYISEYEFDNMKQLEEEIKYSLPDEMFKDIWTPLTVAAFKLRQVKNAASNTDVDYDEERENSSFVIPDFVYNF